MSKILERVVETEIGSEFPTDHLEILNFYGTEVAFIWNKDKLIIFPYHPNFTRDGEMQIIDSRSLVIEKLIAPKPLKSICSYLGRIFIICEPTGIYKLSKKLKFVVLSKTGIGLGCEVHQVLTPIKDCLYLADKITKKSKPLFQLYENVNYRNQNGIIVYDLRQILLSGDSDDDHGDKYCLITSGKKLFKLLDQRVIIIYTEANFITDILPIKRDKKDYGVGLITKGNYFVLLLSEKDPHSLIPWKKLYYDGIITAATIYACQASTNQLWFFYTNGQNIYHRTAQTVCCGHDSNDNVEIVYTSNKKVINCVTTRGTRLVMLSSGQLIEFNIVNMEPITEKREFNTLKEEMVRNANIIVDKICERAKQLELVNKELTLAQRRLERTSIYSHKEKPQYSPAINIFKVGGRTYLKLKLEGLPLDSQVFVNVAIDGEKEFASKIVRHRVTILEIPLEVEGKLREVYKFDVRIDLVAAHHETQLWCIFNNYGSADGSCRIATNGKQFLNAKLNTLRSLIDKKGIDYVKLRSIKTSIRKELGN
ncbi:uncharacterized protein LOC135167603 [Diachasmimorpha longicaudata]|uniref:uncharacterized protein LOC135167603 n=1 Tax=Diachasmimorpha longicaudata TaxID=58733 RepID=UPI0030B89637